MGFVMGHLTGRSKLFAPLDEEELINFHRNPIILLQASPVEMCLEWNWCHRQRGGDGGPGLASLTPRAPPIPSASLRV